MHQVLEGWEDMGGAEEDMGELEEEQFQEGIQYQIEFCQFQCMPLQFGGH